MAEAHTALAYATLHFYWDCAAAEREFLRALSLNPNYPTAHQWYGSYLAALGRFQEAIAEIDHALNLDPLSLMINADRGWLLFFARQHDRAIEQLRKTIEMDPNFPLAHWLLGINKEQTGGIEDAISELRKAASLSEAIPFALASLGHALARSGKQEDARAVLEQLSELSARRYVSPYSMATVHIGLGQVNQAIEWLDRAADERSNWMIFLNVDPIFDPIRTEPGCRRIAQRIGLAV